MSQKTNESVTIRPYKTLDYPEVKAILSAGGLFYEPMAFVFRLAVNPEFKNAGIGIMLMAHVEKELFSRGYKEVQILIDAKNEQLQDYYAKRGYEKGNVYRWMTKES